MSIRASKELFTLLDLCVSSLRRGHANLLCIVPILTDDPRRESNKVYFGVRPAIRLWWRGGARILLPPTNHAPTTHQPPVNYLGNPFYHHGLQNYSLLTTPATRLPPSMSKPANPQPPFRAQLHMHTHQLPHNFRLINHQVPTNCLLIT